MEFDLLSMKWSGFEIEIKEISEVVINRSFKK
jgi:hypothetical protein